ncbi:hypothetical protein [Holdemania sp. 1001302B_160321_E10]|uniref:hypothetical protein n=1 Tax=Holdemania sp. 1001302B_160321_E10 TaxID=2787120 RepID=UPI001897C01E|nr:hypothetical protein [Holdemania sp. 1001302B_160321_E10]
MTTNEAARAYAVVAASMIPQQLRQDRVRCMIALYNQMVELMDIYTETEIIAKMHNLIGQEDR